MTFIVHERDGTEKKRIVLTSNGLLKGFIGAILIAAFFNIGIPELEQWAKQQGSDALRPTMEALANDGKDEASLWLAKHYIKENEQRLADLAARGNAEAMYMQGLLLARQGDKEGGKRLMEQSAAKGFAPAVEQINVAF
jgi:hypothetical protein